jgi:hypothetical protein
MNKCSMGAGSVWELFPMISQHYDNELLNAECHYAKCRYAGCHSAECRGAFLMSAQMLIYNGKFYHGVISPK